MDYHFRTAKVPVVMSKLLEAFWGCLRDVLKMFWGCFDVLDMFWGCFRYVLVMFFRDVLFPAWHPEVQVPDSRKDSGADSALGPIAKLPYREAPHREAPQSKSVLELMSP